MVVDYKSNIVTHLCFSWTLEKNCLIFRVQLNNNYNIGFLFICNRLYLMNICLLRYMMLHFFPVFCPGQVQYLSGTKHWKKNKAFMFLYNIFFFWKMFYLFFFNQIDLIIVFCSFYVISPPTDSYIFRILLLFTVERVAWMSLIPPRSCESSRQIFLAAAADQSGGHSLPVCYRNRGTGFPLVCRSAVDIVRR